MLDLCCFTLHCCMWASHCRGFSSCRAHALGAQASVVVTPELSRTPACGIFPHQGLNPCLLYWEADSLLLDHQ